jgi:RNA polymerase sigma-70 factor (ECF subfamily)
MNEFQEIEAAKKDPRLFSHFYDRYYKEIFLFINRRTDDEDLTADITQQVFLKAMQNLPRFEYRGIPFSAWLYRIASNEVMQHFRDASKVRTVSMESEDLNQLMADVDETSAEEKKNAALKAIRKLNAADLELIEMRFFEKRSFSEIADIKGITENHAKVKTYRILDKIRFLITDEIGQQ